MIGVDILAKHVGSALIGAALLACIPAGVANAQAPTCTERSLTDPPRVMYDCGGGLLLEREAAAQMGFLTATSGGAVEVSAGAVLVEVAPTEGGFQIRTPHAIASVRGTTYVVDVTAERTSVFVEEGVVEVTEIGGGPAVTLNPGDGVDVTPGAPLTVREWGAARVTALMARFGR
ncbi:FecR domain-containing protein [Acuticoccus kandeliae]|uniref:FecR domain-containing protein n=1 Tax=Acuticoccus kandeliae TaxID=2073160 RepID=UPI000E3BB348|nr:FecR domain-containing protein [Acuticoccus kandeliae]